MWNKLCVPHMEGEFSTLTVHCTSIMLPFCMLLPMVSNKWMVEKNPQGTDDTGNERRACPPYLVGVLAWPDTALKCPDIAIAPRHLGCNLGHVAPKLRGISNYLPDLTQANALLNGYPHLSSHTTHQHSTISEKHHYGCGMVAFLQ